MGTVTFKGVRRQHQSYVLLGDNEDKTANLTSRWDDVLAVAGSVRARPRLRATETAISRLARRHGGDDFPSGSREEPGRGDLTPLDVMGKPRTEGDKILRPNLARPPGDAGHSVQQRPGCIRLRASASGSGLSATF